MAGPRSTVLNSGSKALVRALGDAVRIPVGRFRVGDAFNFDPSPTATAPSGNLVDTGYIDRIGLDLISDNELKSTLNFAEDIGNFSIGNIVIDLLVEDEYIPFLMWVSDIPIPKFKFDNTTGKLGNRLALSFTEKIENINSTLDITVLPTVYASLPQYKDETSLPPAVTALFQTGVLQTWGTLFRPVVYARRSIDDTYFGFPLLDRVDNPFFGERDGGISGFNYAPYTGSWFWGGYIDTADADFSEEIISGGSLTDKDSDFGDTLQCEPINYGAI